MKSIFKWMLLALLSIGLFQVNCSAVQTDRVDGSNVVAVYNYNAGMLGSVYDPNNKTYTKYFGNVVDSVVAVDPASGVTTLVTKYAYDKGGKIMSVLDHKSGDVTYFDPNGKKLMTAKGEADAQNVVDIFKLLVQGKFTEAFNAIVSGIKGIASICEYDSTNSFIKKEHQFGFVDAGVIVDGAPVGAGGKVVSTGYIEYVDGKPKYQYSNYNQVDKNGTVVTPEAYAKMTQTEKEGVSWMKASAPILVAEYKYAGNTLTSIDYYNASKEVYRRDIFENGRMEKTVDASGNMLADYVYDGAKLVEVDEYAEGKTISSKTFMDQFGRESFTKDSAGQITARWFYNDTGKDQTVTITDPDVVATLKKNMPSNAKLNGDSIVMTYKAGQCMYKQDYLDPAGTAAVSYRNTTYYNGSNQALITAQEVVGVKNATMTSAALNTTGTDPKASMHVTVDKEGRIIGEIDMASMYSMTLGELKSKGSLSAQEKTILSELEASQGKGSATLDSIYKPANGKATVYLQTLDPAKLAALRATFGGARTVDANAVKNMTLESQLKAAALTQNGDVITGKDLICTWNFTGASDVDGKKVIFVENIG